MRHQKRSSGIRQKRENIDTVSFKAHCNLFFTSRNLPTFSQNDQIQADFRDSIQWRK